ncbi:MAG: ThiF family adenylyltransferase [Clostridiales bacterium]|nr:ThiF family adenylyltransferase [Candidatus Apopatousia equi]
MGMHDRTKIVIGEDALKKLRDSKVIIFGIGGVGGYVAEMLSRSGIGNLTLVDFDVVSESNVNRQIVALNSTIGVEKVVVMKNRIGDIDKSINVETKIEKLTEENINSFNLQSFDYVIDCIDMVKSKIALMKYCYENNIKLISSMGTGNRNGIPDFEVKDIYETKDDGLARVLRRELKKIGVQKATVVCSNNHPISSRELGSIVYFPASASCLISACVVEQLIK